MFIVRKLILAVLVLLGATTHAQAGAAQLLYTLTGDTEVTFTVATQPIPDVVFPDGFLIRNVHVRVNGISQLRNVGFVRDLSSGGLIVSESDLNLAGPQLFTGTFAAPTLLAGNFTLTGFDNPSRTFALSVTAVSAAVPEPESWLLMVVGFALAGMALRSRKRPFSQRRPGRQIGAA